MWTPAKPLPLTIEQKKQLQTWMRAQNTPQSVAVRCRIVLKAAEGLPNQRIAEDLRVSRPTVLLWRQRFAARGPNALTEIEAGRGRKASIPAVKVKQIVEATLKTKPKGATHWSCRTMARAQHVSPATIQRIWEAHGLQPHRIQTFKLSRDKRLVEKLTDVVGLYLNPPDKAVVLCVDEKSQIQALQRTQPGLPLKKGRCGTLTHDYKRHGTTTLFAALNVLAGKVIADCMPRHRHQEFLKFLRRLDREFPSDLKLHLVVDNYGTHKHAKVKAWLERHPRFQFHFIPTSSSWLNMVERWFGQLTQKQIRRGSFHTSRSLSKRSTSISRLTTKIRNPLSGPLRQNPSWRRSTVVNPFMRHYTSAGNLWDWLCSREPT
jgi:transposase